MIEKETLQKISFHFLDKSFAFRNRKKVKVLLSQICKSENVAFESMTYIFCSDQYLLSINKKFLNHNYYTDIITFNLAESNQPFVGEVYISFDRVKDNSKKLQQPFATELRRVVFHGVLHLCGYKDKSKKDITLMRSMEDYYLAEFEKLNVPRGTT